jgi:lipoprotein-anchoring transpeptidase ErfK/SrfK
VAALVALVPLIPIVIAVLMSGGGAVARPVAPAPSPFKVAGSVPRPTAARLALPPGRGALVAFVRHASPLRAAPGGRVLARAQTRTPFGSPNVMLVTRVAGRWLGVVSPLVGNHRIGWIRATNASLSRVDWSLRVSLSRRRLTVTRGTRVVQRYTVAIGMPSAPTPTGRFAVTDRLLTGDPAGPYGCCILALSAKAPHAIQDWSGGDRIAIHSTPATSSIGLPVSHGCMRLTLAEGRWLIDHVPLGTPAVITS